MRKKFWIMLALLFVIPGLLFTASCAKKAVQSDASMTTQKQADDDAMAAQQARAKAQADQEAAEAKAAQIQQLQQEAAQREMMMARNQFLNENIYFNFDSSDILPLAEEVLMRKAQYLKDNPGISAQIQGHCDERGTNEYNMALGERRANAAMKYLSDLGVSSARLTTISYGEEMPVDPRHNEEAWAKNRRAEFVIQ